MCGPLFWGREKAMHLAPLGLCDPLLATGPPFLTEDPSLFDESLGCPEPVGRQWARPGEALRLRPAVD